LLQHVSVHIKPSSGSHIILLHGAQYTPTTGQNMRP